MRDSMWLVQSCPFCRKALPKTDEEELGGEQNMKRVEANDPVAINQQGVEQYERGNYRSALEYWKKAATLGDADAHFKLSIVYHLGHGVEKDRGKQIHHLEEAAIGGHPLARYNLGCLALARKRNKERAVKHFIIAAKQGQDESIKKLMKLFKEGYVEKEDLAASLRAHKAAVDATKSPQRKVAEEYFRNMGLYGSI